MGGGIFHVGGGGKYFHKRIKNLFIYVYYVLRIRHIRREFKPDTPSLNTALVGRYENKIVHFFIHKRNIIW